MLLKACYKCGRLIPYSDKHCPECQQKADAQRAERYKQSMRGAQQRYNAKRDPKYTRFYKSAEWRILSRRRLMDDKYRCVKCGRIAAEVDHIIEIQTAAGWERRLEYSNTQSLCTDCHNAKHERFQKKHKDPIQAGVLPF